MNKNLSPNFVSAILAGFTILILVALPVRLEFVPSEVEAQDASTQADDVTVSQNETTVSQADDDTNASQAAFNVVEFTLRTQLGGDPAMAFVGVGGDIDGIVNPELVIGLGDVVQITVINGDPALHDLRIDEFGVYTGELIEDEQTATIEFVATQPGNFNYYCTVPGHRQVGMEGLLRVVGTVTAGDEDALDESLVDDGYGSGETAPDAETLTAEPTVDDAVSIVRNPTDLPAPLNNDDSPKHHVVEMTAVEVDGQIADGTTYHYMTFDGQVPGPMLRMTVGDTMELRLTNEMESLLPHSIDLHAVTGPGGGAEFTQTMAGEVSVFNFRALQPGLYIYHCATASIGHHISSGMYGMILVEPVGGLPPVDHEFYVMQGEIYTEQPFGTEGHLGFSHEKMLDEDAEYYVFNGAANALTLDEYALRAEVGDTVRIYFGVGGPNAISSFHVIGEIFDRVYDEGSLTSEPLTNVQTTLVPPGGTTVVEFTLDVPGRYILVDHALSRLERGLAGYLYAEGEENDTIFSSGNVPEQSGH
ncbi:nitrite reductase, copper-containing [Phototrophicus methaneseepsis]|uniref:Copper-containing nitrite reductase n=1 Tax=Phototrophicus methaneseepsis TaxID=2710758 RepID=A0A7S8EBH1_9CHLR|nr:copper-containing nitrite reductase [Phototrophicus methaneseepsis]QPC83708.1 nitrite reductase, copper-containing [Phototrophicus methaneseepsis]